MKNIISNLIESFKSKKAKIGVIGLGYVGLPLMLRYHRVGFDVTGFDVDDNKINKLNNGESYIEHIPSADIADQNDNKWCATADFEKIADMDAIILCLPTPLNKHREPDISYVTETVDRIAPYIRAGQVMSLESTTYPGTTEEELLTRIEKQGLKVGKDYFLVYSPEREDPGNKDFTTHTIPKVVGGHSKACLSVGVALYNQVIDEVVPVSSTKVAEMTKLLENIHRSVNIGLVNEMKIVCDKMGINIFEVIDAAATKPFGFTPYYPGPGLGGHCIPIDPFYLTWKAKEYGVSTRFIELSGEINQAMPNYVMTKLMNALNVVGKPIKGSKILVLGIAYKKNVDDMRESPSVEILEILREKEAIFYYSDPHVPIFPKMREHSFHMGSMDLTEENLSGMDAVIIATNHDKFDYEFILKHAQLIIDTRGIYQSIKDEKVVMA